MKVLYGTPDVYHVVTDKVTYGNPESIIIPTGDGPRAMLFGADPVIGVLKHVVIEDDFWRTVVVQADDECHIEKNKDGKYRIAATHDNTHEATLVGIHSRLKFCHGNLSDEYPEQIMAVRFVKPDVTVLEIGGNVGRNSCVIASILKDPPKQFVVLECDAESAAQLCENRDNNSLSFHVIPAALSRTRLIQNDGITVPIEDGEQVPEYWNEVPTMAWQLLKDTVAALGISNTFDTLVADCEGALYYILQDEPTFFDGFHTVIMESDYE